VTSGRSIKERERLAWMIPALNYATETSDGHPHNFQDIFSLQDIPVVEPQRPEFLPLDLHAELHLRLDRTAIAH